MNETAPEFSLFCYGTLEYPEIMRRVTGACFAGESAVLHGFVRFMVKGQVYPAIVSDASGRVAGTLYRHLSDEHLRRLDCYEGDAYSRISVRVITTGGRVLQALAYVYGKENQHLLSREAWDRKVFERRHMRRYMEAI